MRGSGVRKVAWLAAGLLVVELVGAMPFVVGPIAADAQPAGESLLSLPDNTWRQLDLAASTRYLTPSFVVTPAPVPDPNPRTRSYSGMVAGGNRVFYFGGGHGSYPGNDVEVFDPASLRWSQSYQPEVCPYTPSAPCYSVYLWSTSLTTPLGRPYVEHAYQIYAYDPSRNGLFAILNNGTWAYDLASGRWTALAGLAAGSTFSPVGSGPGNHLLFAFDGGLGAFQAVVTAGDTRGTYRFDDRTGRWTQRGMPPETGWTALYSTYAANRGVHFVYADSWTQKWWKYDAQKDQWTGLPVPPAVPDSFDYDSRNGVVVAVNHSTPGSVRVMVFDPDALRWTDVPALTPGPPMHDGINGTPMAWRYVPSYNVFIFLAGGRGYSAGGPSTTWAYRYKGTGGPAVSSSDVTVATATLPAPAAAAQGSSAVPPPVAPAAAGSVATSSGIPGGTVANPTTNAPVPTVLSQPADGSMTFAQRCAQPGVVRCFGFDSAESIAPFLYRAWDNTIRATFDPTIKASGAGSLKMTVPSLSGANTSGAFTMNFTPDSLNGSSTDPYPDQFGEGQEFYVQWRQRFSKEFLANRWAGGGGWKQIDIGEGDRTGVAVASCTQLEMVVNNGYYTGFPRMYHSCGDKDGQYQGLYVEIPRPGRSTPEIRLQNMVPGCTYENEVVPPCVGYKADQWMTFQIHIKIGTWYKNDKNYHHDSTVELWVAEENKPSALVLSITDYDIANQNPAAKYGKLWLMPYNTGKDPTVPAPEAYTWYDEVIVSRTKIADPGAVDVGTSPLLVSPGATTTSTTTITSTPPTETTVPSTPSANTPVQSTPPTNTTVPSINTSASIGTPTTTSVAPPTNSAPPPVAVLSANTNGSGTSGKPANTNQAVVSIDKNPPASGHGERTDFKVFFVNPTRSAVSGHVTVTIGTDSGAGSQQPTYVVSVDGIQIYVGANPTFTWNTHNVANGQHVVTALVRGEAGATGQSSMIVTVSNAKKRRIGSPQPRAPQSG